MVEKIFSFVTYHDFVLLDEEERSLSEVKRAQQEEDGELQVDNDARVVGHVSAQDVAEQQSEPSQQKKKCAQRATNPVVVMSKASSTSCWKIITSTHMSSAISDTKSGMQM